MKISRIKVSNFRLLRDFELNVEDDLSLIIGKNNCGKTSLLAALDKFINDKANSREFKCDDFNLDFQKELKNLTEEESYEIYPFVGLSLKLFITYSNTDNLANLSKVLMDLDPANNTVILAFEYRLPEIVFPEFRNGYFEYKAEQETKIDERYASPEGAEQDVVDKLEAIKAEKKSMIFYDFLKRNQNRYFRLYKKTVLFDPATQSEKDDEYIDLIAENIQLDKILNLKIISAKRDVSNKENDKTLSYLSSKYYEKKESNTADSDEIKKFKDTLDDTDKHLDSVYESLFKNLVNKVNLFGGLRKGDSAIKIISTLQHRELLKGNTTVMYDHNEEHSLPEHYNGLGYMNLIGMIFEIEVLLTEFRKEYSSTDLPADINLLLIEEPEAHTHPQMQYVFIKNIKGILQSASNGDDGRMFNLQTIITTHSSHIAAEGQFNDIKYFTRIAKNSVIAKNLKDLEKQYIKDGQKENFKFLKQYLTLNRAELFFADKAVFIEGDTERILLPAMMKKIDQVNPDNPLLSQNISIVEVGAYSHIFEKFIDFIGVKSLIISDIDSGIEGGNACMVEDANARVTTNASLKFFHNAVSDIDHYRKLPFKFKILRKRHKSNPVRWISNRLGNVLMVYQTKETNSSGVEYHARSFEDAFFHLNHKFIVDNKATFKSLKNIDNFDTVPADPYTLAENCIDKKPSFAMEILLNSKPDTTGKIEYSNWEIPGYINEGLLWLKGN
jgi:predicted ATP-dependent endonuclease of OLD family